jgi:hypothetical protein
MTEQNAGRASALALSIRRMFMTAAASTKPVDGGNRAVDIASAIIEAIDAVDPIDLPLPQERALLRCRVIAATMPTLPHNEKEQTHLTLLAESGAICASELLRLVEIAEVRQDRRRIASQIVVTRTPRLVPLRLWTGNWRAITARG